MNEELTDKIIDRIKTEQIAPLPRWRFYFWRGAFWIFTVFSIMFGSLAVAAIFFLFFDYQTQGFFIPHEVTELLLSIPYVWLIIFIMFLMVGQESLKHTQKGYKYSLKTVVLISISASVVIGYSLYILGIGKITHEFFEQKIPGYNFVTYDVKDIWDRPNIGKLAGEVMVIENNDNFSIIDFNGRVWHIHLATSTSGNFIPEASSTIRMSGFIEPSTNNFVAQTITEWGIEKNK